jgi:hypothetical protein
MVASRDFIEAPEIEDDGEIHPIEAPEAPRTTGDLIKSLLAKMGPAEWGSLAALSLILIIGWWGMLHFLNRENRSAKVDTRLRTFSLPITGKLATVRDMQHGWRLRQPGDRAKSHFQMLPYTTVTLDPATKGSGYVRVWFCDGKGATRGDIITLKFTNGAFVDGGRGEKVLSPQSITVSGTEGYDSLTQHAAYAAGQDSRWWIKLEEGVDYSDGPWSVLGTSDLSNKTAE